MIWAKIKSLSCIKGERNTNRKSLKLHRNKLLKPPFIIKSRAVLSFFNPVTHYQSKALKNSDQRKTNTEGGCVKPTSNICSVKRTGSYITCSMFSLKQDRRIKVLKARSAPRL